MLFAQDIVARNPGTDVVFDVKCSHHLTQFVSKYGGRPIMWKSGHAYMKQKIQETGAQLGGEFSGHFYFGERWYGFDDGLYAAARLIEIISGSNASLEDLQAELPTSLSTPEIQIAVPDEDKFRVVSDLAELGDFGSGKIITLDGIRVNYEDGWGLVRASNTTAALTLRFEASNDDALTRIQQQFREQLRNLAPDLPVNF